MYQLFEFFKPCKFLTTLTVYFAFIVQQSPLLNLSTLRLLRLYIRENIHKAIKIVYNVCYSVVKCATILANICLGYVVWNYLYIVVYCGPIVVLYKRLFTIPP